MAADGEKQTFLCASFSQAPSAGAQLPPQIQLTQECSSTHTTSVPLVYAGPFPGEDGHPPSLPSSPSRAGYVPRPRPARDASRPSFLATQSPPARRPRHLTFRSVIHRRGLPCGLPGPSQPNDAVRFQERTNEMGPTAGDATRRRHSPRMSLSVHDSCIALLPVLLSLQVETKPDRRALERAALTKE
jgi:hypothetical protein